MRTTLPDLYLDDFTLVSLPSSSHLATVGLDEGEMAGEEAERGIGDGEEARGRPVRRWSRSRAPRRS